MSYGIRLSLLFRMLGVVGLSLAATALLSSHQSFRANAEDHSRVVIDKNTCIASRQNVYVEYENWSECLSYYVIGEITPTRAAIIFLEGDFDEPIQTKEMLQSFFELISYAANVFRDEKVPVVILGRPGIFGSTGDHRIRHHVTEYGLVARAIEQLVERFGLTRVALVGHSGGSSAIMGALSLGMKEGNCIVAGSGAYDVADITESKYLAKGLTVSKEQKREWRERGFSHHRSLGGIASAVSRRIFLVGDPTDPFAPFRQQVRYAESLQRAGHLVRLVEAKSKRGDGHSLVDESLRAAARCLKGDDDERVVRAVGGIDRTP